MSDIKLKKLVREDIEQVRKWRNKKEVASYMYSEKDITKQQQIKWFENLDWKKSIYWIIEYEGKKLGLASISNIDKILQSCYWAFYLGDTSVRGAGIGAKVEYNVISYVFEKLKLNKLRCEVFVFNESVIKMHEKFGFRREAYYRQHCMKNEKWQDVVGLALLREEWENIKHIHYERIYKHK